MTESDFWGTVKVVLLVVLIVGGIWIYLAGPCEWWAWVTVGNVPVRCIGHFVPGGSGGG